MTNKSLAALFFGCIIVAMALKWWYVKIPLSERKAIRSFDE